MFKHFNLDKTYQNLLIILAFLMPLTVFGANFIVVVICLLWIFSGNYKSKFNEIIDSKLMLASITFFVLHLVGMIWTEDIRWGWHIIHKMWYFLLFFPILYTITNKKYIKFYISSFLLAISFSEILSYLVWFELIEPIKQATVYNPTIFMSHIQYNPILAFAIYLVLHEILFNKKLLKLELALYSFFAVSMTFNMFITGGRAGQVMFFAMLAIIIFQYFRTEWLKAIVVILIVTSTIFFTAYQSSTIFHNRVLETISSIENYESNKGTSLGIRIAMTLNSWEVIKKNPILGVGTGDFPLEYKKVNQKNTPDLPNATNPHNMYILILMQLGIMGLVSFGSIFYFQIKQSFLSKNKFIRDVGLTLPLLYLVIMWSDTYLLGHYNSLLFVFFSSFLYKNFRKSY
jgi:O-antigen ligase